MQTNFKLDNFISTYVTKRTESLLKPDLKKYYTTLSNRINGKKVLVIGGAGTIGSSYIKAILKFRIAKLVVVDINENGLTELVRDLRSSTEYNIPEEFISRRKTGHRFNLRIVYAAILTAFVYPGFHFIPPRAINNRPQWGKKLTEAPS